MNRLKLKTQSYCQYGHSGLSRQLPACPQIKNVVWQIRFPKTADLQDTIQPTDFRTTIPSPTSFARTEAIRVETTFLQILRTKQSHQTVEPAQCAGLSLNAVSGIVTLDLADTAQSTSMPNRAKAQSVLRSEIFSRYSSVHL